jgi:hypothetical protein
MKKINNNDLNLENNIISDNNNNKNDLSMTLNQGIQFKKYQQKFKTNKRNKDIANDLEKNNISGITGFNKLNGNQPSNIVEGFDNSGLSSLESQLAELKTLETSYSNLIQQLKIEQQNATNTTNTYVDQTNVNNNPYLNKNVTTKSDGRTYYITGEGVAKLYGSASDYTQIIGKNNCPSTTQQIDSMPSYINTIDGTNMIVGQQCGNEGKNVLVNKMVLDSGTTFIGCYNDSLQTPAMTAINNGLQDYNFTSCKQMSVDTGNLYFGLQNLNPTTKKSACYVSNDYTKTTQYKKATPDTVPCQIDTSDNYIYGGPLVNAIYKTPDATYLGLLAKNKETTPPAMTLLNDGTATFTYETCKQVAKKASKSFFGLQDFNITTQKSACLTGNDISQIKSSIDAGATGYVTGTTDKKKYGTIQNQNIAIYQVDAQKSDYIGCYNDNETSPAMTAVGAGASTYSFDSCQQSAITSGKKYFALQGGTKGTSKCFVGDDLTAAQKYGLYEACIVNSADQNKYGVNGINAVYQMNAVGDPSYMGKMGYVDSNSKLLEYPSTMITPGTNYSKYLEYDSNSKTLKTNTNTTYTACVDECNLSNNYYGFVFNNTSKIGYLKGADILNPTLKKINTETDLYIRDFKINGADPSCNKDIIPIDSNQWSHYNKGTQQMSSITTCSLTQQLVTPNSKIADLQNQIVQVASQITIILSNLQKQNDDIKNNIGTSSDQINADLKSYNKVVTNIQNYKKGETNMNNIVKDTNLLVLYQNYNYIFWSILAISTVIISMKMVGK